MLAMLRNVGVAKAGWIAVPSMSQPARRRWDRDRAQARSPLGTPLLCHSLGRP